MRDKLFGYHSIEEYLKKESVAGDLFISKSNNRIKRLTDIANKKNVPVHRIPEREMEKLAGSCDHRGALFIRNISNREEKTSIFNEVDPQKKNLFFSCSKEKENSLVLILDSITDPHNLGAVLRSADLFGIDMVFLPARRSARDTATVMKTSAGAGAYVPLSIVSNLAAVMEQLKKSGFWIYGADMEGSSIASVDLRGKIAIAMGAEGKGLSRLLRERCDGLIGIETAGNIDSLNVSVAAGIMMYEVRRQQLWPSSK